MENPLSIANFFIEKSMKEGCLLTNMQAVKLTYIAHGWYLGLAGQPLLNEVPQAWMYGPVVRSVYEEFKSYGRNQITQLAWQNLPSGQTSNYPLSDQSLVPFLEQIWKQYGEFTGPQLSELTHKPGTPWDEVWHRRGGKDNLEVPIPNPLIEQHYKLLAERNLQSA
jgi:uncharacterized phage-associated protein